ncbi:1-acyl-sn-glycerol-3-phosphate acyltransferase [Longimycelium tulufanense]|uniref:1-acyl-sn-glycerol-3-phosphate acyltransferase n=1 Tax=Longimycelium tulufanense TaxID=907463 RepID=A0A8J3C608_9PSEU|nr:lysophospholipid acyltransferase family protein [Longimycelium tulufanense]GGM36050.1 1-acyl-sn-glycerol-3-phosphate acyltransferase [Longimycelium tulufanense]
MSHGDVVVRRCATHPWMPVSPCGDHCLAPDAGEARVGVPRRAFRLTVVAALMLVAVPTAVVYPLLGNRLGGRVSKLWFRSLLKAFGVRLVLRGDRRFAVSGQGALVVTNHCSWLDIVALGAVQPVRMLAKTDVRKWPLVGWFAAVAGTVFVDRERLSTLPVTVTELATVMRDGGVVGVFPEGTTWCGVESGRYRSAPFQAARDADAVVRPVALRYLVAGRFSAAPAFVGDSTLWDSVRRVSRMRGLTLEIEVLPELSARSGANRRDLAALAETAVATATWRGSDRGDRPEQSPVAA